MFSPRARGFSNHRLRLSHPLRRWWRWWPPANRSHAVAHGHSHGVEHAWLHAMGSMGSIAPPVTPVIPRPPTVEIRHIRHSHGRCFWRGERHRHRGWTRRWLRRRPGGWHGFFLGFGFPHLLQPEQHHLSCLLSLIAHNLDLVETDPLGWRVHANVQTSTTSIADGLDVFPSSTDKQTYHVTWHLEQFILHRLGQLIVHGTTFLRQGLPDQGFGPHDVTRDVDITFIGNSIVIHFDLRIGPVTDLLDVFSPSTQ
mmetsp:Transcript_68452/g.150501  ORF Transcript_68452/g.150501 Transcript_68452/m.150501 type:complete len:254 (+) Transcript_68452:147-908(+)